MTALEPRQCLSCNKPLKGRIDKKFCDDYCRNNYNNEQKSKSNFSPYVRNINNALLKNRKILESVLPENEELAKTTQEKLLQKGFLFKYHTHTYKNKKEQTYFFCYDYGYLPLGEGWILVVRRKDEV
jgi:predicted nucleic acid-binding Zn ribbon protein